MKFKLVTGLVMVFLVTFLYAPLFKAALQYWYPEGYATVTEIFRPIRKE